MYMWYGKVVAATKHALFSLVIALIAALLVYGIWFPDQYTDIMMGAKLFLVLIVVEVTLGPCMSLVIYDPNKAKRELYWDYTIIIFIQVAALIYGLSSVFQTRPIYIAFVKDRLEIVAAAEIDSADIKMATDKEFRSIPFSGPHIICPRSADTPSEREYLLFEAMPAGKDVQHLPKFFQHCEPGQIYHGAKALSSLESLLVARTETELTRQLRAIQNKNPALKWLPAVSRFGVWVAVIDNEDNPVVYLPFDPF